MTHKHAITEICDLFLLASAARNAKQYDRAAELSRLACDLISEVSAARVRRLDELRARLDMSFRFLKC